ncbi:unnamed protein product [Bursaphelenchus xylophilus]|uniref:(pine wood nematode) hypothetical protein n=1 Tax=Bursaphelenchus xylophilus TaxID=6326 RepID=A0A7I8XGI8_BURXY|nr:unnamed protein product [Bursaphelenchus xylophilus]CAG9081553.1 unnamed protein product [Bursaphelenchus xylophilus]
MIRKEFRRQGQGLLQIPYRQFSDISHDQNKGGLGLYEHNNFDGSISLKAELVIVDFVRTRDQGFILQSDTEWPCYPDSFPLVQDFGPPQRSRYEGFFHLRRHLLGDQKDRR